MNKLEGDYGRNIALCRPAAVYLLKEVNYENMANKKVHPGNYVPLSFHSDPNPPLGHVDVLCCVSLFSRS